MKTPLAMLIIRQVEIEKKIIKHHVPSTQAGEQMTELQ